MSVATDAFGNGLIAVTEALRLTANDPADQVRLLSNLAAFTPAGITGPSGLGTMTTATGALCRRAALASLATACAAYEPSSYDDAITVKASVVALFDAEITIAADAGDTASYGALRDLSAAVADDLDARGADLPHLQIVTENVPLPALALAYKLYRDATRAADLIARADPPHPAFMPVSFQALTS